jgi:hypothetical protein
LIGVSRDVIAGYFGADFASSGNRDFSKRRDRVGGSALRLISFDAIDSDGESMLDIPCGKMVNFEIKFQVLFGTISNLRFGMKLSDNFSGKYITDLNSYYGSGEIFVSEKGIHRFVFMVDKLPLAPGNYNLDFIVTSGLEVLDWIKDACQLTITDGLFYESEQMPLPGSYPVFFTDFRCNMSSKE